MCPRRESRQLGRTRQSGHVSGFARFGGGRPRRTEFLARKLKHNHEAKLRHQDKDREPSSVRLADYLEFPYSASGLA